MTDEGHEENFSYTPTFTGDSYQPILPANADVPKAFVPPKGGTGARTIELKVVPIPTTDKK